jgi:hypothetical protein
MVGKTRANLLSILIPHNEGTELSDMYPRHRFMENLNFIIESVLLFKELIGGLIIVYPVIELASLSI